MNKLDFNKMLKKESAHDIITKHIKGEITLTDSQLDVVISKNKGIKAKR